MWDTISQFVIFFTGVAAIFLVARRNKWGFVLGLIGQPFWFITTYLHGQWGLFFLNFAYAFVWGYGIYEWFFKKSPPISAEI